MEILQFDFSTAITEPPTSNQVRLDAAAPADVTRAWVRYQTTDGIDAAAILAALPIGTTVYVQDKNDHTLYAKYTVRAATVDKATYVELPITYVASAGALLNNQAVIVVVLGPADTAGGGGGGGTTIVSLQAAVDHLLLPIVLDTDPIDPRQRDLELKLRAAEAIILDYLKTPPAEWTNESNTPPNIRAAILLQLGELWRFRGDDPANTGAAVEDGQLSPAITALLRRYRDPALA